MIGRRINTSPAVTDSKVLPRLTRPDATPATPISGAGPFPAVSSSKRPARPPASWARDIGPPRTPRFQAIFPSPFPEALRSLR